MSQLLLGGWAIVSVDRDFLEQFCRVAKFSCECPPVICRSLEGLEKKLGAVPSLQAVIFDMRLSVVKVNAVVAQLQKSSSVMLQFARFVGFFSSAQDLKLYMPECSNLHKVFAFPVSDRFIENNLRQLLASFPPHPRLSRQVADLAGLMAQEKWAEFDRIVGLGIKYFAASGKYFVLQVLGLLVRKQFAEAATVCGAVLPKFPTFAPLNHLAVVCQLELENYEDAIKILAQETSSAGGDDFALQLRTFALLVSAVNNHGLRASFGGNVNLAQQIFVLALNKTSRFPDQHRYLLYYNYAQTLLKLGLSDKSFAYFKASAQLSPKGFVEPLLACARLIENKKRQLRARLENPQKVASPDLPPVNQELSTLIKDSNPHGKGGGLQVQKVALLESADMQSAEVLQESADVHSVDVLQESADVHSVDVLQESADVHSVDVLQESAANALLRDNSGGAEQRDFFTEDFFDVDEPAPASDTLDLLRSMSADEPLQLSEQDQSWLVDDLGLPQTLPVGSGTSLPEEKLHDSLDLSSSNAVKVDERDLSAAQPVSEVLPSVAIGSEEVEQNKESSPTKDDSASGLTMELEEVKSSLPKNGASLPLAVSRDLINQINAVRSEFIMFRLDFSQFQKKLEELEKQAQQSS